MSAPDPNLVGNGARADAKLKITRVRPNDDDRTTYILHVFSDPCFSRAGVLLPPCMSIGDKNCGRAADTHPLQHIQSTAKMVKKQNHELDFPIIVFC